MFSLNKDIPYQTPIVLDAFDYNNKKQLLVLRKPFDPKRSEVYYLYLYLVGDNGDYIHQGYLYFSIDFQMNKSKFIGTYIKPEYRNTSLASFLISSWIKLCIDSDILSLVTAKRQSKPFLLHILKTFNFEIANILDYESLPNTIYICKKENDLTKFLFFKDEKQADFFKKSNALNNDNYNILDNIDENMEIIDKVLMNRFYNMLDGDFAYSKAIKTYSKRRL